MLYGIDPLLDDDGAGADFIAGVIHQGEEHIQ